MFDKVKPQDSIRVAPREILLGLGAYNDMNETVIRYRNVRVRRAAPGEPSAVEAVETGDGT